MKTLLPALLALAGSAALAHDYPTADRVVFVQACMRDHPGPHYEMINKCSCALDKIASELSFEAFTDMTTATNANSIGGERGSYMRDAESIQQSVRKYRQILANAKKGCFINLEPR